MSNAFLQDAYFPVLDEALDGVLRALGERRYIFPEDNAIIGAHPCIHKGVLYVRGKPVISFSPEENAIGRLALWGASFTVFAEKLSSLRIRNSASLLACVVLKTDRLLGVKTMPKLANLLKGINW